MENIRRGMYQVLAKMDEEIIIMIDHSNGEKYIHQFITNWRIILNTTKRIIKNEKYS